MGKVSIHTIPDLVDFEDLDWGHAPPRLLTEDQYRILHQLPLETNKKTSKKKLRDTEGLEDISASVTLLESDEEKGELYAFYKGEKKEKLAGIGHFARTKLVQNENGEWKICKIHYREIGNKPAEEAALIRKLGRFARHYETYSNKRKKNIDHLLMDYETGVPLYGLTHWIKTATDDDRLDFLISFMQAFCQMREQGIVHGDTNNSGNLLYDPGCRKAAFIDFGNSHSEDYPNQKSKQGPFGLFSSKLDAFGLSRELGSAMGIGTHGCNHMTDETIKNDLARSAVAGILTAFGDASLTPQAALEMLKKVKAGLPEQPHETTDLNVSHVNFSHIPAPEEEVAALLASLNKDHVIRFVLDGPAPETPEDTRELSKKCTYLFSLLHRQGYTWVSDTLHLLSPEAVMDKDAWGGHKVREDSQSINLPDPVNVEAAMVEFASEIHADLGGIESNHPHLLKKIDSKKIGTAVDNRDVEGVKLQADRLAKSGSPILKSLGDKLLVFCGLVMLAAGITLIATGVGVPLGIGLAGVGGSLTAFTLGRHSLLNAVKSCMPAQHHEEMSPRPSKS